MPQEFVMQQKNVAMENSSLKIGDKVVCINDRFDDFNCFTEHVLYFPKLMEIYTIRGFYDKSIYLEEIVNPLITNEDGEVLGEPCFYIWRFIKLEGASEELELKCSGAWTVLFE